MCCFIPGGMTTSDGPTRSISSVNLRNLVAINVFRIVTEEREKEIRKQIPEANRYIVYPGTIQGGKDLDADVRRKTRAGRIA